MTVVPAGSSGGRLSVPERLARLLGVIPWVVERGGAHVEEIAARFDYPRDQLLEDLTQVVFFVGVHPFTPDTLIEVDITDEIVEIRYADWFSRPLRLSTHDATRLLAAGRSVLDMASRDRDGSPDAVSEAGPLMRALAKLTLTLGDGAADAVGQIDVSLGDAPTDTLDALRAAVARRRRIDIEYYSLGRDQLTWRAVDPAIVFSHDGQWYLSGWCHRARAERVFRVDRIRSVDVTEAPVEVELPEAAAPGLDIDRVESRATLRLGPDAAWVSEYYPTLDCVDADDGSVDATLAVTGIPWLERLLLQLGPHAQMVAHDASIATDVRAGAARRVLARYGT